MKMLAQPLVNSAGEIVNEFLAFPRGHHLHPEYGELNFDDAFFDQIIGNFYSGVLGKTEPFIDQEHDKGKAAGWVKGMRKDPEGLHFQTEWTPLGVSLLTDKIYRYFSPWWQSEFEQDGEIVAQNVLRGGALTNTPFLKDAGPVSLTEPVTKLWERGRNYLLCDLQEPSADAELKRRLGDLDQRIGRLLELTKGKKGMPAIRTFLQEARKRLDAYLSESAGRGKHEDRKELSEMERAELIKSLGLDEKATDEQITKALGDLKTKAAAKTPEGDGKDKGSDDSELGTRVTALEKTLTEKSAKILDLINNEAKAKAEAAVEKALSEGKISADGKAEALAMALLSLDAFNKHVEKLPKLDGKYLEETGTGHESDALELTEAEIRIAKQLGTNLDTLRKLKAEEKGITLKDDGKGKEQKALNERIAALEKAFAQQSQ